MVTACPRKYKRDYVVNVYQVCPVSLGCFLLSVLPLICNTENNHFAVQIISRSTSRCRENLIVLVCVMCCRGSP